MSFVIMFLQSFGGIFTPKVERKKLLACNEQKINDARNISKNLGYTCIDFNVVKIMNACNIRFALAKPLYKASNSSHYAMF